MHMLSRARSPDAVVSFAICIDRVRLQSKWNLINDSDLSYRAQDTILHSRTDTRDAQLELV